MTLATTKRSAVKAGYLTRQDLRTRFGFSPGKISGLTTLWNKTGNKGLIHVKFGNVNYYPPDQPLLKPQPTLFEKQTNGRRPISEDRIWKLEKRVDLLFGKLKLVFGA